MGSKNMAIATQMIGRIGYQAAAAWPIDNRPTSTLVGRDALEQIRGAHVDPAYGQRVDAALSVLLAHRADCGFYPPRNAPGLDWMQLAGYIERMRSTLGRPPNRMTTRWVREWQ